MANRGATTNEVLFRELRARRERGRVFVAVEDDDARILIAQMLKLEGYDVFEARDGEALVDGLIRSLTGTPPRAPDLVITAARLGGVSGIDVLRRLRRFDHLTPVIVLAGEGEAALASEAEALGANQVLRAPYDYADLCYAALELLIP